MLKAKVLIVEDDIITAMALRKDLQDQGYSVCSLATSGEKAIKIAENEYFDVILMDIKLKGKIDRFETAREIRSRFSIPVIYMTGYPEKMVREAGIKESYKYYSKPVEIMRMKKAIDSVLQKKNCI